MHICLYSIKHTCSTKFLQQLSPMLSVYSATRMSNIKFLQHRTHTPCSKQLNHTSPVLAWGGSPCHTVKWADKHSLCRILDYVYISCSQCWVYTVPHTYAAPNSCSTGQARPQRHIQRLPSSTPSYPFYRLEALLTRMNNSMNRLTHCPKSHTVPLESYTPNYRVHTSAHTLTRVSIW